jgi:cytochrome c-type biogenesis protein CcmH
MVFLSRKVGIFLCLLLSLGLSSLAQALEWQDVAGELMSPACPGRTLSNCTSSQAEQWRELIRQKLAQGESKSQILQHFVDIEGESILASPPKKGFALTVWLFPMFIVLNGAVMILLLARRWTYRASRNAQDSSLPPGPKAFHNPTHSPPAPDVTKDPVDLTRYRERLKKELDDFDM